MPSPLWSSRSDYVFSIGTQAENWSCGPGVRSKPGPAAPLAHAVLPWFRQCVSRRRQTALGETQGCSTGAQGRATSAEDRSFKGVLAANRGAADAAGALGKPRPTGMSGAKSKKGPRLRSTKCASRGRLTQRAIHLWTAQSGNQEKKFTGDIHGGLRSRRGSPSRQRGSVSFGEGLKNLVQSWPLIRLVNAWNGIDGTVPVSEFAKCKIATTRNPQAIQNFEPAARKVPTKREKNASD